MKKFTQVTLIVTLLIAAFSVFATPVTAQGDSCTLNPGADDILVVFDNIRLRSDKDLAFSQFRVVDVNLSEAIPAGTYSVELQSYDHHIRTDGLDETQEHERWFIEIDSVATNAIVDLPDALDYITEVVNDDYVVASDASSLTVKHIFFDTRTRGEPNSVEPICALFSPVSTPGEWNKSSLEFGNTVVSGGMVSAEICNVGDGDMTGTVEWELYYAAKGNAKKGAVIADGTVGPLDSGECTTIMTSDQGLDGNFKFRAEQEAGHPGKGELWSN